MSRQYHDEDVVNYVRVADLIKRGRRERSLAMWALLRKIFAKPTEDGRKGQAFASGGVASCPRC